MTINHKRELLKVWKYVKYYDARQIKKKWKQWNSMSQYNYHCISLVFFILLLCFRLSDWLSLLCLGPWINHLPPVCQTVYHLAKLFWSRWVDVTPTSEVTSVTIRQILKPHLSRSWPRSNIWSLEFNWYVCFLFHDNWTIFDWDRSNSIFDLENSRLRSRWKSNPMATFEPKSSIDMFAFHFMAIGLFLVEIKQIPYL